MMGAGFAIYYLLTAFHFVYSHSGFSIWQCPQRTVLGATPLFFLHSFKHKRSRMILSPYLSQRAPIETALPSLSAYYYIPDIPLLGEMCPYIYYQLDGIALQFLI